MFAYNVQLLVETKYNIYKIYIKYTLLEYKKHFDDHAVTGCNKAFFYNLTSLLTQECVEQTLQCLTCIHHRPRVLAESSCCHTPPNGNESWKKSSNHSIV